MLGKTTHKAFFLVPPEVQLLDLTGPAHLFYEAKEYGAPIDIHYLSLGDEKECVSSAGISLGQLKAFDQFELTENDLLFLPGLESHLFFDEAFVTKLRPFFDWLEKQAERGAKVCSVCTGAYFLGLAGLLDHKFCTTHWKYLKDFQERFPKAKLLSDRLLVKDGNLYSSAGVSSGIDLTLYLLEELFGSIFAAKIAKEVVIYFRRTENDPQLSVFLQYRNHVENRIHQVQDELAQNLAQKQKIEELAEIVHMSPRNLTRLFRKTTGITIGDYLEKLRVEHAVQLLSAGSKVNTAAMACGLQSSNQLRSLLRKHKSVLPSQLRS
ncbi:helix-turn-helix domain-containing protein [Flavobacteriaceae bacterium TP-CH-4]|uniref:Helix-turn-helix domain-containing protein n=1 Tax=Pelagihabitans pacificus TaxID=2696054 RepID=A0A967AUW7_9FLAO|nr:helix-turn-helix domain-containing protein [Pelagihabitans pacificus]NHF60831.1 helix-turn-helix domain-containing protein [Pelagihabitans pacificus]